MARRTERGRDVAESNSSHQLAEAQCPQCRSRFADEVCRWSRSNRRDFPWRRPERTDFELVVAELLLQQTRAEAVAALVPIVVDRYPNWAALASADASQLGELIRPLGLHRRRTSALIRLGKAVLDLNEFPATAQELSKLPGIGQYMSRVIALQLFGEVTDAPVDVNVARVLERVFGSRKLADIRYDPYLQELARSTPPDGLEVEYTLGLLDFAAAICKQRRPNCGACPMTFCRARTLGLADRG